MLNCISRLQGTELTFNYRFEVSGDGKRKKKCLCGSSKCAGFIGDKYVEKNVKKTPKNKLKRKRGKLEIAPGFKTPSVKRKLSTESNSSSQSSRIKRMKVEDDAENYEIEHEENQGELEI